MDSASRPHARPKVGERSSWKEALPSRNAARGPPARRPASPAAAARLGWRLLVPRPTAIASVREKFTGRWSADVFARKPAPSPTSFERTSGVRITCRRDSALAGHQRAECPWLSPQRGHDPTPAHRDARGPHGGYPLRARRRGPEIRRWRSPTRILRVRRRFGHGKRRSALRWPWQLQRFERIQPEPFAEQRRGVVDVASVLTSQVELFDHRPFDTRLQRVNSALKPAPA